MSKWLRIFSILLCINVNILAQDASLAKRVDKYLAPFVQGKNFTGVVLVAKDDKVLFNKAYGPANLSFGVPNNKDTRFHIASISKPFTATAILILEERGKLKLDDPISKYVPDFTRGNEITLQNLLMHTSGIPNVNDFPDYDRLARSPQTPKSLVDMFKGKPLNFAPGTKYEYSNSNYNLLALVIEQVSGKSYGDFMAENIFTPLGLHDTGHDGRASDIYINMAAGFQPSGVAGLENAPYIDWSAKTGNGSLFSTSHDLLKFLLAYRDGKIIPKNKVAEVWSPRPGHNFGWFVRSSDGETVIATNGRSPGFTSSLEYYPAIDITVIVLSNSYSPVSQNPIADDIVAMAMGKPVAMPEHIVPVPVKPAELAKYEGTYRFGNDFFRHNAQLDLHIIKGEAVLDWGNDFKTALIPVGPGEFMDRQFWARIKMNADGSGFTYSTSGREFKVLKLANID